MPSVGSGSSYGHDDKPNTGVVCALHVKPYVANWRSICPFSATDLIVVFYCAAGICALSTFTLKVKTARYMVWCDEKDAKGAGLFVCKLEPA